MCHFLELYRGEDGTVEQTETADEEAVDDVEVSLELLEDVRMATEEGEHGAADVAGERGTVVGVAILREGREGRGRGEGERREGRGGGREGEKGEGGREEGEGVL